MFAMSIMHTISTMSTMSNNNEILDINIDFAKASYKWMENKYKHSSGVYKYYCKITNIFCRWPHFWQCSG